jgi:hypothetical protein
MGDRDREIQEVVMKWRDAKLNTSGYELIYETPGDKERGNPLDIIPVVQVYGGTDILGFKFPVKKMTKELCTRWNCFQELFAAMEKIAEAMPGADLEANNYERQRIARAAIAAVKKEQERV